MPPNYLNVVQVKLDEFRVVVLDAFDRLLDVRIVWRILRENLLGGVLGDAVPAHADRLALVQQRRVILVLVHHGVEAQDS